MCHVIPHPRVIWSGRRHELAAGVLAASVCLSCLPVRDLSGYSGPDDHSGAAALPEPIDDRTPPAAGPRAVPTAGEGTRTPSFAAPGAPSGSPASTAGAAAERGGDAGTPWVSADAGSTRIDAGSAPADAGNARLGNPDEMSIVVDCAPGESAGPSGYCYIVVRELLNWSSARSRCQSRGFGWDLTSIRTLAESLYMQELITEEVWVGGSDATAEASWTWVDDGSAFWQGSASAGVAINDAFINWYANEPNGLLTSDCLRLLGDAQWADFECTELRAAVCKGPGR